MEKKGFELAFSTLITIVIGILVLIGLAYILTSGFAMFKSSTKPFIDTTAVSAVKQGCGLACANADRLTFCCKNYTIDRQQVSCKDARLEVACELKCEGFSCAG